VNASVHDRIESIAGAIALNEATDEERREYREHIAACAACLRALGGEHEIERVAQTVAHAKESEIWDPRLGDVVGSRLRRRARALRWAGSVFGAALAVSLGVQALVAMGAGKITSAPPATDTPVTRVVLERSVTPVRTRVVAAPRRLVVTHNVVQIARAPLSAPPVVPPEPKARTAPREMIAMTVHPDPSISETKRKQDAPPAQPEQTWRTVAQTTTTSVTETAPQTLTHYAESIQVSTGVTREVAPVGGESAISPQPPLIAYDEGAEGTTVFEVRVDERGVPTKCIITKPAGYPVLDESVCKAAMKVRYTPKMVDGRAVPGVYRDAFTFHMTEQSSNREGVQQQIPIAGPQGGSGSP